MNPFRDISPPRSPIPNQSNLTSALDQRLNDPHVVPVDNTNSIARRQETQDSLRQASVALDAAYERVTQLRVNINNLLNRMPPEFTEGRLSAHNRTPESSIAPQHAALVLTGSDASESDLELDRRVQRLRTIVSPSARQRLEDFESMARRRRASASERTLDVSRNRSHRWDISADPPSRVLPPRPRSPPLPDLILPTNNWNPTPLSSSPEERTPFRREFGIISPDDPSTMIGRRVAARTAISSSERRNITSPPLEQQLQDQTALIARDLAGLASRLVMRGVRRVEAARQAESQQPTSNDGSVLQGQLTFRAPSDTNMDWEATIPQSYNNPLLALMSDSAAPSSSTYPQPSSSTNRRWTSENSEQTLQREDWDYGSTSLPQRLPPHYLIARSWPRQATANTTGESSTSLGPVRGGRLDADGDEIISDDEDEIERNRRSRLRLMYALPDATVTSASPRPDEDRFLPFASTTIIHSLDDEPEAIRVRINTPQESKNAFSHSFSSRTYPQHVDPLPTPISEMLRHSVVPPQAQPRFIPVSQHASFAGR